jgi:phage terminase small subunit
MMKIPRPPGGLKAPGKTFWKKVLSEYNLSDAHALKQLELASGCLDQIKEAEAVLKSDGLFTLNRYSVRVENPAAESARKNKVIFCRIIRELGLDLDGNEGSRPRRQY